MSFPIDFPYKQEQKRSDHDHKPGKVMMGFQIITHLQHIITDHRKRGVAVIPHDRFPKQLPILHEQEFL